MKKNLKKHLLYYVSLFSIFFVGFILTLFAPDLKSQSLIIVITIILYVVWGILHHYINHELTLKIVVEYSLIGLLGVSILFFVMSGVSL